MGKSVTGYLHAFAKFLFGLPKPGALWVETALPYGCGLTGGNAPGRRKPYSMIGTARF